MAKVLPQFKRHFEAYEIVAGDGGRFEVLVDGETVYSKLATGSFPDEDEVIAALKQHAAT